MKLASIEKVIEVFPHPNADALEFVKVLGYQCIVPKGKWNVGDWCVLIQPDTVLPDAEWAMVYKAKSKRVKAIRLRGEWSFGIVEDLSIIPHGFGFEYVRSEGDEVSEYIGVTKYESPQPNNLEAKGGLPFGIPKTDEERWQNLKIEKFIGQPCIVTQKIDGQSFTAYYKDGQFGITGRTQEMKLEYDNNFIRNAAKYDLERKLRDYGYNIAIRGEQYGGGIQNIDKNPHSKQAVGLMFFSVLNLDTMKYLAPQDMLAVFAELDLPTVPVLEIGLLTAEMIDKYSNIDNLNGEMFEGVVIAGDGWSFKVINLNYDSKK